MSRKNSTKDFEFETCIGEGSYSKVYKAVSIHNHRTYAIKVLNKSHIVKEKKIKYVNIEKNTLNKLGHHPGIVTLHYTFQDSDSLYFVIDFALNGELLSLIRKWGSLSEAVSKYYAIQLVDAVEFIHSKGIIHRDLKPENILLNHDYKLMITDFGAAKIVEDTDVSQIEDTKKEFSDSRAGSFVGTAEYVSPELLKYNQCGFECDYWAVGCILYQLITGYPPFKGNTEYLTFEKIIKLDYKFPSYYIPSKIKQLISSILVLKPEQRYNINDIKGHEWFKEINWSNKDFIWKRRVPKFESYNPKLYLHKKEPSPFITQKTRFDSSKFYVPPGAQPQSSISSIPTSVLQKQIMTPQYNQQAMNKALTQRLIIKNNELNLQQRNAASAASAAASASNNNNSINSANKNNIVNNSKGLPKMEPVNRMRSATTPALSPISTTSIPPQRSKNGSVARPASKAPLSAPLPQPQGTPPLPQQQQQQFSVSSNSIMPKSSASNGFNKPPNTTINTVSHLVKKSLSGTKAVRKRSASKSTSPTPVTPVQSKSTASSPALLSESEVIDLVPLASVSDVPLLPDEYILKADSIYKSELPYTLPQDQQYNLDDTFLNKLIDENYEGLNDDLKSSLLIITSLGRLLIYEFTPVASSISTLDPKFMSRSSPKKYKETKLIVVNLTNKNISMYEFDGVFIIKDNHLPNIIFLNPAENQAKSPKYASAPPPFSDAEQPAIVINRDVSWIDTLLKAKDLLKSSDATSPSSESEFSSSTDYEVSLSPVEALGNGFHGMSVADTSAVTASSSAGLQGAQKQRKASALAQPTVVGSRISSSSAQSAARPGIAPNSATTSSSRVSSTSSPQSSTAPTRSISNGSISYHYTQQQKTQPHAHQANFTFLAQTKQNKFASAAAAASFKK